MAIDLHTHSLISDGVDAPEALVAMAKERGLFALAVSDHDTLEGSRRAQAEGERIGVRVIPAVEISANHAKTVLHVLGYFVDAHDAEFERALSEVRDSRVQRAMTMVERVNAELRAEGKVLIDPETILRMGKEKPVTRPDIALELVRLGNAASRDEAFERWLERLNVPTTDFPVTEAIRMVHAAGGVAVLAHPFSDFISLRTVSAERDDHLRILRELKDAGLDGMEAYRGGQTPEESAAFAALAREFGLVPTGGSDYHGVRPGWPSVIGENGAPDEVIAELEKRR